MKENIIKKISGRKGESWRKRCRVKEKESKWKLRGGYEVYYYMYTVGY